MRREVGSQGARRRDAGLDRVVARVLLAGLAVAVVLLLVGAVLVLARPEAELAGRTSISGIPAAVASLAPNGFFDLGLLVLVAVPGAGLMALGAVFARRRSWLFLGLSLFAVAVLVLSAFLGFSA